MKLEYNINESKHAVIFCKNKEMSKISQSLSTFKTDKNILFLFDSKIDKKIIEIIFNELKLSGCNIIKVECVSDKINKNEKLLFKILDILIGK